MNEPWRQSTSAFSLVQLHSRSGSVWARVDQIDSIADRSNGGARVTLRRGSWWDVTETADEVVERIRAAFKALGQ